MPTPRQSRLRYFTLLRALEIVGTERALARALHVPALDLGAWLKGAETPPIAVFLAAVDIVDLGGTPDGVRVDRGDAGVSLGR